MEGGLGEFRRKLKEIDEKKEFPCREEEHEILLDMNVFHYEEWSKQQDSVNGRSSTSKVDVVLEFPKNKPVVIIALEYKGFVPTRKGNKPYGDLFNKEGRLNEERLEKIADEFCSKIVKKFSDFCREYLLIWNDVEEIICFILLYPPREKYEEFAKKLLMMLMPFPSLLKELSKEKKIERRESLLRARIVNAYEKLLDITSSKIKASMESNKCCGETFVGECERLKRLVSTFEMEVGEFS